MASCILLRCWCVWSLLCPSYSFCLCYLFPFLYWCVWFRLQSQHGYTALAAACWESHLSVVQYLVTQGADINIANTVSDVWRNHYKFCWYGFIHLLLFFPISRTPMPHIICSVCIGRWHRTGFSFGSDWTMDVENSTVSATVLVSNGSTQTCRLKECKLECIMLQLYLWSQRFGCDIFVSVISFLNNNAVPY